MLSPLIPSSTHPVTFVTLTSSPSIQATSAISRARPMPLPMPCPVWKRMPSTPLMRKPLTPAMATVQQDDPELQNLPHSSTLQLRAVPLPTANATLLCDMNIGTPRPYMPQPFRCAVFDVLHSLSHPGIRATQRLITTCYLWPSINADLRKSACSCLQCQRTKVHQHTFTPTGTFVMPDA